MKDWETKAAEKRESIRNSIPKEWIIPNISPSSVPRALDFPFHEHLSAAEMEITGLSVVELLSRISKGQYKSVDVARAFAHRAAIAHQLVNCCLEFFWDVAEKQALALDEYYQKHGKVVGPLHGLPISLKGIFPCKYQLTKINSALKELKRPWVMLDGLETSRRLIPY
jgi:amidase